MKTALALGLGAVGLYVLYRFAQASALPPGAALPPAASGPPPLASSRNLQQLGDNVATRILIRGIGAAEEIITGTSGASTFKTFASQSDAEFLKYAMCNCYKQGAGAETQPRGASCRAVQQMSPGLRCKGGDCDCNPTFPSNGVVEYRDSHGGPYRASFGPKSLATEWTAK